MKRIVHFLLVLGILASIIGVDVAAAQAADLLDLADVPLPVQSLPESGYQVLSGGYLTSAEIVSLIADPRNLDHALVHNQLAAMGVSRAYVLDLVLPEDRAWQNSPFLAVVQTSVYTLQESEATELLTDVLSNYSNTAWVDQREAAFDGAVTVAIVGESGDQLRTIVIDGRVVIEIVSLDGTGVPDETEHMLIVDATIERLHRLRESGENGLSPMALTLLPGPDVSLLAHTQQSGIHGMYRFRDDNVQPAIGELSTPYWPLVSGLESLYVSSSIVSDGGGYGVVSVWLGEFNSINTATIFLDALIMNSPGVTIDDPFFSRGADESWTEQGVLGIYRVTGTLNDQPSTGYIEVRQDEDIVVVIGYRSVGSTLSSAAITSQLMDHQLVCLRNEQVCQPFDLASAMPPPQATPVLESDSIGSSEFGWSLPGFDADWMITDRFIEPGYDRIELRNGVSIFSLESVINYHGEPVQCVLDELRLLQEFEDHSAITLWEDAAGTTEGGSSEGHAWTVYRVEPLAEERADQEYVVRIDCFALVPGSANLVVAHIAPIDFWVEEQYKGDYLRDNIQLPASWDSHGKMVISAHDWMTLMILTPWIDRSA